MKNKTEMSSAEETLTDLKQWLKEQFDDANEKRRHALSAGEDMFALTAKYERDAYRNTLDFLDWIAERNEMARLAKKYIKSGDSDV